MIDPLEFVTNPLAFEKWRPIDIEGIVKDYYWISTCGRVKNIKWQFLKAYIRIARCFGWDAEMNRFND